MKATICAGEREGKGKSLYVTAPGQTFPLTHQDWEDVHLVGAEVIVQEVSLSSIRHQEAVSEREGRTLIKCGASSFRLSPLTLLSANVLALLGVIRKRRALPYRSCSPLVELQLETATNHHLSLAVLKFRVPLQEIRAAAPVLFRVRRVQPEMTIAVVRLMN